LNELRVERSKNELRRAKTGRLISRRAVQRFVIRENIARFERLLADAASHDGKERNRLQALLASAQRELALLDASSVGLQEAQALSSSLRGTFNRDPNAVRDFQRRFEASELGYMLLDPRPGLHIIDVNDAFVRATSTSRESVTGERLFEAFPENPEFEEADGIANAFASLKVAAETRQAHIMPTQRYDVRDGDGKFVPSYWRAEHTPILDDDGRLLYLLHNSENLNNQVLGRLGGDGTA
jgi:PAS domain-containing protein